MNDAQLRQTLEALHAELEHTENLDDESRRRLEHVMSDIQSVLSAQGQAPAQHYHSLGERLRESINDIEDSHPRLTLSIGKVLDNLAAIGL